jgi:hypothetical protein
MGRIRSERRTAKEHQRKTSNQRESLSCLHQNAVKRNGHLYEAIGLGKKPKR